MITPDSVTAAGLLRDGNLWMVAKCPTCDLATVLVFDRKMQLLEKRSSCEHFISFWRDEAQMKFNFQR